MNMIGKDFLNIEKIHFVGVGGVSMSGLAKFCLMKGFSVSGSDRVSSAETKKLSALGGKIYIGHSAANVRGAELVVYSSAIDGDNPEIRYAVRNGIPILKRSELLGRILETYPYTVAVSGSHGKTTATAMLAEILIADGRDPAVFLGGESKSFGNFRSGSGCAVAEACEYKRNFFDIRPDIAVVLNIDHDHVDTFKDKKSAAEAFAVFARGAKCVINADDDYARSISGVCSVTFGIKNPACFTAKYISKDAEKAFTVYAYGRKLGRIKLKVAGEHNVYNALAATAAARELNVGFSAIKTALCAFDGVKRRNEYLGELCGAKCFADYAHHPTEIRAVLRALKEKTLVVFQPHTYSRTASLMNDFVDALRLPDGLIIYKTYPAREKYSAAGDAKTLYENAAKEYGQKVKYAGGRAELEREIRTLLKGYSRVLFLGAGDVYDVAKKMIKKM